MWRCGVSKWKDYEDFNSSIELQCFEEMRIDIEIYEKSREFWKSFNIISTGV